MGQIIDLATFKFNDSELITSIANVQKSLLELKTKVADNNKEYKNNQQSINLLIASQNSLAISGNKNTDAYKANEKSLLELNNSQTKLLQTNAVLTNNISGLNGNLREQQTILNGVSQTASGTETPYKNLNAEMNKMKTEAKNLGAELIILEREGKKGTAEYTELEKKFKETSESAIKLDKEFKALDGTVGDNQRNVGNYSESIINAYNELEKQKQALIENKTELENQVAKLENLTASVDENSDEYKNNIQIMNLFVTQINVLNAEIGNVDKAMSKSTSGMNSNAGATKNLGDAQISLRTQLRNAKQEVAELSEKYGANSAEAINAAKKAAQLADAFGDSNALINAFNPDAKFKALTASLSGVAGGFGAVQGAISLMGVESEEVQKQLLKVQSAMAISQGLQDVGESIDSFRQLGAVIKNLSFVQGILNFVKTGSLKIQKEEIVSTAVAVTSQTALATATAGTATATTFATLATKAFRIALIATGIGAVVVGLGLLIANFSEVKNAVYNVVPGLRNFGNFMSNIVDKITDFVGATSDASRELDGLKKSADKSLSINKKFLQEHGDQIDEYTKKKIEANNEYFEAIKEEGADVKALRDRANREIAKADEDRNNEINEKRKKASDDAQAEFKKEDDKRKQRAKEIADAQKKEVEDQIKNAQELANAQIETAKLTLASYLIDNQSKLTDAKRLTQDLINEENKRLDAVLEKNRDILTAETRTKQDILNAEIKALKDKETLSESEKLRLADLNTEKLNLAIDYSNKDKELVNATETAKKDNKTKYAEQAKVEEDERKLIQHQEELNNLETQLANEFDKKQAQLDFEYETNTERKKAQAELDAIFNAELELLKIDSNAVLDEAALQRRADLQQKLTNIDYGHAKASVDIAQQKENAKLQLASSIAGNIASIAGKESAVGKAMAIAQTTISTYQSAQDAYKSLVGIPVVGPALATGAAGLAIAGGIANIAKIQGVNVGGVADGLSGLSANLVSVGSFSKPSVDTFEVGGILKGNSHANGGIPALVGGNSVVELEGGEAVINKKSTAKYTNLLSIINQDQGGVKFANGGVVGSNLQSVQNNFTQNLDLTAMAEMIGQKVYEGATVGTASGSQKGIIGLSENRQVANNANF